MKKMRIICILLAVALILNVGVAYFPKKDTSLNWIVSASDDYSQVVEDWQSDTTVAEILNDSQTSITPGEKNTKYGSDSGDFPVSALSDKAVLKYYYEGKNYAYGIKADNTEIIAFRQGNGALLDVLGGAAEKITVRCSYANAQNTAESRTDAIVTGGVASFSEKTVDGNVQLTVIYELTKKLAESATVNVIYTFNENSIGVAFQINAESGENYSPFTANGACIIRNYINGYIESRAAVNSKWIYPDDLDYPYPDTESIVYIDTIDENHKMYTAYRNIQDVTETNMTEDRRGDNIPLPIPTDETVTYGTNEYKVTSSIDYTYCYDLSFVDLTSEKQNPDYLGLFKGMNTDFAVGISPVVPTDDNTTVFTGEAVDLNLNITNLKSSTITYSLRYDVRNYSGEVVDAGVFIDNTLLPHNEANRVIHVDAKDGNYGMLYLNLYAISSENSVYSECYPFALLEDYTYKYNSTSPFGIASISAGSAVYKNQSYDYIYDRYINAAKLFSKIGVSNFRIGSQPAALKMAEYAKNSGINRINGGTAYSNINESGVEKALADYEKEVRALAPYVDAIECGNELNLLLEKGLLYNDYGTKITSADEAFALYYKNGYRVTYDKLQELNAEFKKTYGHTIKYLPTPSSRTNTTWTIRFLGKKYENESIDEDNTVETVVKDAFYGLRYQDTDGDGVPEFTGTYETGEENVWDELGAVSTHIYCNPYLPDELDRFSWNIERGMIRMRDFLNEFRNSDSSVKDFYITEIGYNTAPEAENTVCLRTQADYIVRVGAISAAYGADRVQFYQLLDRTSQNSGYNNSNGEYNFGLFYKHDYYEIVKPKPSGVAFAVMTRNLECMKKDGGSICEKYDEGGTERGVRAFVYDTQLEGEPEVVVAYSNKEVLTNGLMPQSGNTASYRTPSLPWNSQWYETDETVFEAHSEQVKVVDIMGNTTYYEAQNGSVTIPLTGSPVYIYGVVIE